MAKNKGKNVIPKAAVKPMQTAIDIIKEAAEAGGVSKEAKSKASRVSMDLLLFAQRCESADEFRAQCRGAEAWAKSEEGIKFGVQYDSSFNGKVPNCWYQVKSDIFTGWSKFDLNPKDYDKPTSMKKAKLEAAVKADPDKAATITINGLKLSTTLSKAIVGIVHDLAIANTASESAQVKVAKLLTGSYQDLSKAIDKVIKADESDLMKAAKAAKDKSKDATDLMGAIPAK